MNMGPFASAIFGGVSPDGASAYVMRKRDGHAERCLGARVRVDLATGDTILANDKLYVETASHGPVCPTGGVRMNIV